jgi:GNAT superfamily N-acetyltransferase
VSAGPGQRLLMSTTVSPREVRIELPTRPVRPEDVPALGALFIAAYRDTVDDEGETLEDAIGEAERILSGGYGPFLWDCSFVTGRDGGVDATSLIARWTPPAGEPVPLLVLLATAPSVQRHGLAAALLNRSIDALADQGEHELRLWVNALNDRAIALYRKLGFDEVV